MGFSSEAELRAQQPPVLPDRERQQGRARERRHAAAAPAAGAAAAGPHGGERAVGV